MTGDNKLSWKAAALMACIVLSLLLLTPAATRAFATETHSVGVKPGDWAAYGDISYDWASNYSESEEVLSGLGSGLGNFTWMTAEILDVSGSNVTSRLTSTLANGTGTNTTGWWDTATFSGNGSITAFIIPSGLGAGDLIPGSEYFINSTVSGRYAGADRETNCLSISNSTEDYDDTTGLSTVTDTNVTAYWDQQTGLLSGLEIQMESTSTNSSISYLTNVSFCIGMSATNMWSAVFTVHEGNPYNITMSSNSSISGFSLNETLKQISFNASGPAGWVSYSDITIPKALLKGDPWIVYINGTDWTDQCSFSENYTHAFIYIPYTCSTNSIRINGTWVVPELSSSLIFPALVMAALLAVICRRRVRRKANHPGDILSTE